MATSTTRLDFDEGAAPATPAASKVRTYAKADGLMYSKDDAGVETLMSGGGAGSVATDAIWDASGDLAVGSGANTAAKLTKGANDTVLTVTAGVVGWAAPGAAGALQAGKVTRTAGDVTTTSTTFVDVTGMSVTLTTGARRCMVAAVATGYVNNVAGTMSLTLDIDGTDVGGATNGLANLGQYVASETQNFSFTFLTDVLTAASHTFKLRFKVYNGAHTGTIQAADPPCILSVVELYTG